MKDKPYPKLNIFKKSKRDANQSEKIERKFTNTAYIELNKFPQPLREDSLFKRRTIDNEAYGIPSDGAGKLK